MDTFTQITLGAAVGEAVLGKKVGNKAILWGAVGGTIPDLDVTIGAFMGPVERLVFHRGFSHSILFTLLFAPIMGYLISKIHRKEEAGWKAWSLLSFWVIATHILLDLFTTYGTQILHPFSRYGFAFNTISVVDPLYTVPFLICVIIVLFLKRGMPARRVVNYLGIGLSSLYLCFTVINKFYVNSVVEASLGKQKIQYDDYMTAPTLLNNVLWRIAVAGDSTIWEGYYSIFSSNHKNIEFKRMDRNRHLLDPYRNTWDVQQLIRVSKGFYAVVPEENGILFVDMRYGQAGWGIRDEANYVFSYQIRGQVDVVKEQLDISRREPSINIDRKFFKDLIERIIVD